MDAIATADLLQPVLADLADVIDGIPAQRLTDPTPCTEMDVSKLRAHVTAWLDTFAGGFADPGGRAPAAPPPGAAEPDSAAIRRAAATLDAAIRAGAAQRPIYLGESSMPGDMALSMILWEYLVHGWDLAAATGQPWHPQDAAAEAATEFAPGMLTPDYQGVGKTFGPRVEVPADAAPMDRLLGLSGRDPGWSPPVVP